MPSAKSSSSMSTIADNSLAGYIPEITTFSEGNLKSLGAVLLVLSGECLAHAGHGTAAAHGHSVDWIQLVAVLGVVVAAAIAARSRK